MQQLQHIVTTPDDYDIDVNQLKATFGLETPPSTPNKPTSTARGGGKSLENPAMKEMQRSAHEDDVLMKAQDEVYLTIL